MPSLVLNLRSENANEQPRIPTKKIKKTHAISPHKPSTYKPTQSMGRREQLIYENLSCWSLPTLIHVEWSACTHQPIQSPESHSKSYWKSSRGELMAHRQASVINKNWLDDYTWLTGCAWWNNGIILINIKQGVFQLQPCSGVINCAVFEKNMQIGRWHCDM